MRFHNKSSRFLICNPCGLLLESIHRMSEVLGLMNPQEQVAFACCSTGSQTAIATRSRLADTVATSSYHCRWSPVQKIRNCHELSRSYFTMSSPFQTHTINSVHFPYTLALPIPITHQNRQIRSRIRNNQRRRRRREEKSKKSQHHVPRTH